MTQWNYGDAYKRNDIDFTKEINVGTGTVKVHDIYNPLPKFMMDADVIFCDPPYNISALKTYYTKAELTEKPETYDSFVVRFFECIEEINPDTVIVETGVKQAEMYFNELDKRFEQIMIFDSWYYGNKSNKCKIIYASHKEIPTIIKEIPPLDEEKVIDYMCKNLDYKCIGDLCMGQGLVAYYSNKYNKRFVGTELNYKRLAVCVERVLKNKR